MRGCYPFKPQVLPAGWQPAVLVAWSQRRCRQRSSSSAVWQSRPIWASKTRIQCLCDVLHQLATIRYPIDNTLAKSLVYARDVPCGLLQRSASYRQSRPLTSCSMCERHSASCRWDMHDGSLTSVCHICCTLICTGSTFRCSDIVHKGVQYRPHSIILASCKPGCKHGFRLAWACRKHVASRSKAIRKPPANLLKT